MIWASRGKEALAVPDIVPASFKEESLAPSDS